MHSDETTLGSFLLLSILQFAAKKHQFLFCCCLSTKVSNKRNVANKCVLGLRVPVINSVLDGLSGEMITPAIG